jgi:hypothetical protein
MTASTLTKQDHAFFAGRAAAQTIATLWELGFYCDRPFDGDLDDLSLAAKALASENDWDLTQDRANLSEEVREYAMGLPLSVLVKSDWTSPGQPMEASQFELLLATGGPAVRVTGELDSDLEPYRPCLQFQDWGTPWTDHPESNVDALYWFAGLFYYGE